MSRPSGPRDDYISITLEDNLSGTRVVNIELPAAAFALAVTGLSNQPCDFEVTSDVAGKVAEYMEQRVPVVLHEYDDRPRVAREAARMFEHDGWLYSGPQADAGKYASWRQNDWISYDNPMGKGEHLTNYMVVLRFVRYVDPPVVVPEMQEAEAAPAGQPIRKRVRRPEQL